MPVISFVGSGTPEVEISLPAAEYVRRNSFGSYHCTFDLYPGRTYPLTPVSLTPKANANQLYTMRLRLEAADAPLPSPGMNTMVSILCNTEGEQQLSVPASAILHEKGQTSLFIFSPVEKKVFSGRVKIIRPLSDGRMLVTSPVLKPGDVVVASGVHHLKEGESVKPLPAPSATNVGNLL